MKKSREITYTKKFQITSGKSKTLSLKSETMLSWSHYCELLKVEESHLKEEAALLLEDGL